MQQNSSKSTDYLLEDSSMKYLNLLSRNISNYISQYPASAIGRAFMAYPTFLHKSVQTTLNTTFSNVEQLS